MDAQVRVRLYRIRVNTSDLIFKEKSNAPTAIPWLRIDSVFEVMIEIETIGFQFLFQVMYRFYSFELMGFNLMVGTHDLFIGIEMDSILGRGIRMLRNEWDDECEQNVNSSCLLNVWQKFLEETEEKLEADLRPDVLERNWNNLVALHQERDQAIHKEIERLERLQRIAEKVHREAKHSDSRLDDIEMRIDEEAKRMDRLHPRDVKHNCDAITADMAVVEEAIKTMFSDVQILKDGRYIQSSDLHKRCPHHWFIYMQSLPIPSNPISSGCIECYCNI